MRDSFEEYKSVVESNVMKFTYLYDGDALSSRDESYSEILKHNNVSSSLIIRCVVDIYKKSIQQMIDNSIGISIPLRPEALSNRPDPKTPDNIFYFLDNLEIKPLYIFCSENSQKMFGIVRKLHDNNSFPGYMDFLKRYNSKNYDLYLSPLIKDHINQFEVYVTDKSIQSLVYSIQNMDYIVENIEGDLGKYKHTIKYKFYNCDYKSYKLNIKNLSRLREDKINQLLNDNKL